MSMLETLVRTGLVADIAIGVMLAEGLLLLLFWWQSGRSIPMQVVLNLAAGLFLLLALRVALEHGSALNICLFLSAALVAHVADFQSRWRRR
jgi:putative Ca2+/H+ antiporter (TMEM165/GDT1 family)